MHETLEAARKIRILTRLKSLSWHLLSHTDKELALSHGYLCSSLFCLFLQSRAWCLLCVVMFTAKCNELVPTSRPVTASALISSGLFLCSSTCLPGWVTWCSQSSWLCMSHCFRHATERTVLLAWLLHDNIQCRCFLPLVACWAPSLLSLLEIWLPGLRVYVHRRRVSQSSSKDRNWKSSQQLGMSFSETFARLLHCNGKEKQKINQCQGMTRSLLWGDLSNKPLILEEYH